MFDTPVMHHDWFTHLETSGSITPETGWHPHHCLAFDNGTMRAAVPAYLHTESWGEFVFDFALAEAVETVGKRYYPKLVGMSPATPISAYSFLTGTIDAQTRHDTYVSTLKSLQQHCRDESIPVLQFNYIVPELVPLFEEAGMTAWVHHGYRWNNAGYTSFDDFRDRFNKNQRRNIRRERNRLREHGLSTAIIPGHEAPHRLFHTMAELYHRTNDRFGPWAARFLTTAFFTDMPASLRKRVLFAAAEKGRRGTGEPLALSMLLHGTDHLMGRYWGTFHDVKDLHFELCYYTPVEWAIQNGIESFDPGMGGDHKARRGFTSVKTYSLHWFADEAIQELFASQVRLVNRQEEMRIDALNAAVPWRNG